MRVGSKRSDRTQQVGLRRYLDRYENSKGTVCSPGHQVDEVIGLGAETFVEGATRVGRITGEPRWMTLSITKLDRADDTGPDVVGSVTEVPLAGRLPCLALATQIREDTPLRQVEQSLCEVSRDSVPRLLEVFICRYVRMRDVVRIRRFPKQLVIGVRSSQLPTLMSHQQPKNPRNYFCIGMEGEC